jgi:hypothetical protein
MKSGIAMTKAAFINNNNNNNNNNKKLEKCCIWRLGLYGAETWTPESGSEIL